MVRRDVKSAARQPASTTATGATPLTAEADAAALGAAGAPRYATLARLLAAQIESGKFAVGSLLPTEAELQARYDVSRHTVREALRELKSRGLIVARAGVGTTVRARAPGRRFVQGVSTLQELIQFFEATRMRTLQRHARPLPPALAARLELPVSEIWHEAALLRYPPEDPRPMATMSIHVRPEHADVLDRIDTSPVPVFSLIEQRHGVQLAEVRQLIVAVALGRPGARLLQARPGAPALEITRAYADARDRVAMIAVGIYPADRFVHSTRFRVHHD
jgi:GntR family transcriptional regulator